LASVRFVRTLEIMGAVELAVSAGVLAVSLAACAQGASDSGGYDPLPGNGGTSATTSSSSGHGGVTTSGGGGDGAASGGSGGFGGAGGEGGQGAGSGGHGGSCDFSAPNSCITTQQLPSIAGDDGNDVRSAQGIGSKWFEIFVEESVSSIIDYPPLSFTATLVSPPTTSYDLYVYFGDSAGISCSAVPLHGTGNPAIVSDTWGDNIGTDDSTWLVVEVRYVSGHDCSTQWSLTIAGNT
jgi:hypothetical protein